MNKTEMIINKEIIIALTSCYDPEINIDIVSLGLIYGINLNPLDNDGYRAEITMTLTSPFCTMSDIFVLEIRRRLLEIEGINEVSVEFIFEPAWSVDMMADEAKLQLDIF